MILFNIMIKNKKLIITTIVIFITIIIINFSYYIKTKYREQFSGDCEEDFLGKTVISFCNGVCTHTWLGLQTDEIEDCTNACLPIARDRLITGASMGSNFIKSHFDKVYIQQTEQQHSETQTVVAAQSVQQSTLLQSLKTHCTTAEEELIDTIIATSNRYGDWVKIGNEENEYSVNSGPETLCGNKGLVLNNNEKFRNSDIKKILKRLSIIGLEWLWVGNYQDILVSQHYTGFRQKYTELDSLYIINGITEKINNRLPLTFEENEIPLFHEPGDNVGYSDSEKTKSNLHSKHYVRIGDKVYLPRSLERSRNQGWFFTQHNIATILENELDRQRRILEELDSTNPEIICKYNKETITGNSDLTKINELGDSFTYTIPGDGSTLTWGKIGDTEQDSGLEVPTLTGDNANLYSKIEYHDNALANARDNCLIPGSLSPMVTPDTLPSIISLPGAPSSYGKYTDDPSSPYINIDNLVNDCFVQKGDAAEGDWGKKIGEGGTYGLLGGQDEKTYDEPTYGEIKTPGGTGTYGLIGTADGQYGKLFDNNFITRGTIEYIRTSGLRWIEYTQTEAELDLLTEYFNSGLSRALALSDAKIQKFTTTDLQNYLINPQELDKYTYIRSGDKVFIPRDDDYMTVGQCAVKKENMKQMDMDVDDDREFDALLAVAYKWESAVPGSPGHPPTRDHYNDENEGCVSNCNQNSNRYIYNSDKSNCPATCHADDTHTKNGTYKSDWRGLGACNSSCTQTSDPTDTLCQGCFIQDFSDNYNFIPQRVGKDQCDAIICGPKTDKSSCNGCYDFTCDECFDETACNSCWSAGIYNMLYSFDTETPQANALKNSNDALEKLQERCNANLLYSHNGSIYPKKNASNYKNLIWNRQDTLPSSGRNIMEHNKDYIGYKWKFVGTPSETQLRTNVITNVYLERELIISMHRTFTIEELNANGLYLQNTEIYIKAGEKYFKPIEPSNILLLKDHIINNEVTITTWPQYNIDVQKGDFIQVGSYYYIIDDIFVELITDYNTEYSTHYNDKKNSFACPLPYDYKLKRSRGGVNTCNNDNEFCGEEDNLTPKEVQESIEGETGYTIDVSGGTPTPPVLTNTTKIYHFDPSKCTGYQYDGNICTQYSERFTFIRNSECPGDCTSDSQREGKCANCFTASGCNSCFTPNWFTEKWTLGQTAAFEKWGEMYDVEGQEVLGPSGDICNPIRPGDNPKPRFDDDGVELIPPNTCEDQGKICRQPCAECNKNGDTDTERSCKNQDPTWVDGAVLSDLQAQRREDGTGKGKKDAVDKYKGCTPSSNDDCLCSPKSHISKYVYQFDNTLSGCPPDCNNLRGYAEGSYCQNCFQKKPSVIGSYIENVQIGDEHNACTGTKSCSVNSNQGWTDIYKTLLSEKNIRDNHCDDVNIHRAGPAIGTRTSVVGCAAEWGTGNDLVNLESKWTQYCGVTQDEPMCAELQSIKTKE